MKITRRQLQELIRSATLDEGPGHKSDPRGPDAPAPGGAVNVDDRDTEKHGAPSEIDLARAGRLGGRTGDALHHQDTKGKGAGGFPGTPQERLKGSGGTQEAPPPAEVEGPEIDYTKGSNPVQQRGAKPLKTKKNESVHKTKITRRQLSNLIKEALFAEAAEVSQEKKDAISRAIMDTLGAEGGAAGLDPLQDAADDESGDDVQVDAAEFMEKEMANQVDQLEDGDYIKKEV